MAAVVVMMAVALGVRITAGEVAAGASEGEGGAGTVNEAVGHHSHSEKRSGITAAVEEVNVAGACLKCDSVRRNRV